MRKLAEHWLSYAEKDLIVARGLLGQPEVYDMAAFHCQQAVEKSLKGLLVLAEIDVPRVHDLTRLYSLAGGVFPLDFDLQVIETTNEFYIETRYPLHEDQGPMEVTEDQLNPMIALADRAVGALRARL